MTVIVKAHSPADLLAMVPSLVGFVPENSVVLVAFRGKRTCGALRYDLPANRTKAEQKRIARKFADTLCRIPGVDFVVPVVYTEAQFGTRAVVPHAAFARILNRTLHDAGLCLRDSLCQAGDGWASYYDDRIPAGGYPLAEIMASATRDIMPPGSHPDPAESLMPIRVTDADEPTRERFAAELAALRPQAAAVELRDRLHEALSPAGDLTLFIEEALEWDDAWLDVHGALFLSMLQRPVVRDLISLQWATDEPMGERMRERERTRSGPWDVFTAFDEVLGDLMMGRGPRPDAERIESGIQLLLRLVARAEDSVRVAPLCMLAWLNWALGYGSRAGRYIDEARTIDPEYGMVEIIDIILTNGLLPEWAFAEVAA